ncbi:MAG TPA: single-stranded DNA-binding protein [Solirubrobacteraceae bacterium]
MSEHEINRVLLSGRLVSDPDLRELADGTPVCVLRLASAAGRRVPGGSRRGAGELGVLVVGRRARRVAPYLYRGRCVVVQGRLEAERWEDGEGPEREAMCVIAECIHFAGDAPRGAQARMPGWRVRAGDAALEMSAAIGFSEQIWG